MYVYGLNTELIDGSSKFEVKTFKTNRQFFVRLFVTRRDSANTRRNNILDLFVMRNVFYRFQRSSLYFQKHQLFYNEKCVFCA